MATSGPQADLFSMRQMSLFFCEISYSGNGRQRRVSRIWTRFLESGRRDPVPLELFIEGTPRNSKSFRGAFDATVLIE